MTATAVFAADSIGKRFGRRRVLTAASIRAYPGRVCTLLGRNGIGKSTLIRIAAGCLGADFGVVMFGEHRWRRPRLATLARLGLFYLPDRSLLCASRTIDQHFAAVRRAFRDSAVDGARAAYRLGSLGARLPHTLSTGERRRAEAALAWSRQPVCLLADEPFRGLAPHDQEILASGLKELARRGCAVIVTGHEVPILLEVADEVVWMTAGTTHHLGDSATAQTNFQFMQDYLGPALGRGRW